MQSWLAYFPKFGKIKRFLAEHFITSWGYCSEFNFTSNFSETQTSWLFHLSPSLTFSPSGLLAKPQQHCEFCTQLPVFLSTPVPACIWTECPCGWLIQYKAQSPWFLVTVTSTPFQPPSLLGPQAETWSSRIAPTPNTHYPSPSSQPPSLEAFSPLSFERWLLSALLKPQSLELPSPAGFIHFSLLASLEVSITDSQPCLCWCPGLLNDC